jgi:hypothetical protein
MKKIAFTSVVLALMVLLLGTNSGCKTYSLNDVGTMPDSVKTVRVNFIENRAPYVNPQLSPSLTDRLKQRITSQTRLTNTSSDNAHWDINGSIVDYSVITTGVQSNNGRQQTTINRLTVTVRMTLFRQLENKTEEFEVSRSFDFSATRSLQAAESALLDDMVRNLTDEIFNRIFSNW